MTSVYTENKLYPNLPSAPADENDEPTSQQSQNYRLKKITELEAFLRCEATQRDKLTKQFKRRAMATTISDTSIRTAILTLEAASLAALTTGVGIPNSIALASTGIFLGLGSAIIHKTHKIFESKVKKHDKIKTLAESKLDSISELVSKAVKDAHISHEECQFILKEIEPETFP